MRNVIEFSLDISFGIYEDQWTVRKCDEFLIDINGIFRMEKFAKMSYVISRTNRFYSVVFFVPIVSTESVSLRSQSLSNTWSDYEHDQWAKYVDIENIHSFFRYSFRATVDRLSETKQSVMIDIILRYEQQKIFYSSRDTSER